MSDSNESCDSNVSDNSDGRSFYSETNQSDSSEGTENSIVSLCNKEPEYVFFTGCYHDY